jgi:hypothetical protein
MAGPFDFIIILMCAIVAYPTYRFAASQTAIEQAKFKRRELEENHKNRMRELELEHEAKIRPLELEAEYSLRKVMVKQQETVAQAQLSVMQNRLDRLALSAAPTADPASPADTSDTDFGKELADITASMHNSTADMAKMYYQSMLEANGQNWDEYVRWARQYGESYLDNEAVSKFINKKLNNRNGETVFIPPFNAPSYKTTVR